MRAIRLCMVMCCAVAIGAQAQQAITVSGLWKSDQFGYSMVLLLNQDGSGSFDGESLRYNVKGKVLTVTIGVEATEYSFTLSGNKLTLAGGDLDGQVTFSRDGANTKASPTVTSLTFSGTSKELIGLWSGEGEMIEFKADGNCRYNGTLFPYQVSQGHVILETTAGPVVFEYVIKDGDLVLTANGQRSVYSRPATGTVQKTTVGRKNPEELVGQWCYLNMSTSAQSSRCITLNADGTYSYSAESSRSVNTSELSGGTSSQSRDSGTWYLEGDRIYYHSYSTGSGSYSLERRNHPKNVNDPMIVLDGEPFVTTTQRPPWR